ncbi:MAG: class I SAM-dependent methyltransferase [Ignavibacteriales bacterium]|nr:class I SAM-dependent methyltransferase [Ignavibacteriales bacterium]
MDRYTEKTKSWLEQRFKRTTNEGIYYAHQPIYGFRGGSSGGWVISSYTVTYQIIKALSHMQFNSLLDVGGAEGYTAALIRSIFKVHVRNCDLSNEACNRAKEIFDIDGESVDIHKLPYSDNEFDIVVCSETLEHVPNFRLATNELLRVCKKAVVITVPHEAKEIIENNIKENIPHAHIHYFDMKTFDFVKPIVKKIKTNKMLSTRLNIPRAIVESKKREKEETSYSSISVIVYNLFRPLFHLVFGKKAVTFLMKLDEKFSKNVKSFSGIIFILLKDEEFFSEIPLRKISASQIINFTVPYYYLNRQH